MRIQSGEFVINKAGKSFGREVFDITSEEETIFSRCQVTLDLPDGFQQQVRLSLDSAWQAKLLELHRIAKGVTENLTIAISGTTATIEKDIDGKHSVEVRNTTADCLLLAGNVFHHFVFFLKRYDFQSGGAQSFHLFPSKRVVMEQKESRSVNVGGRSKVLRRLFVDIESVFGIRLVILDDQLIRVESPLQRVEAVLKGIPEMDQLFGDDANRRESLSPVPGMWPLTMWDVVIPSEDDVSLAGTVTAPENASRPMPGVVLISGSGAQDRNNDTVGSGGIHYGMFRTIAERLSATGLAVLRYDDRGVGRSTGNFESAGLFNLVEDARSALRFLGNLPSIDPNRLAIVGHSEGGLIASMIAAGDHRICAIVTLGMLAHSLDQTLLRQFEKISGRLLSDSVRETAIERRRKSLETIKTSGDWESPEVEDALRDAVPKAHRQWFNDHFSVDASCIIQQVTAAVAICQGGRDFHIDRSDAHELHIALDEAGHTDHVLMLFPQLDHLFMRATEAGLSEYANEDRQLDEEFIAALVQWLSSKLGA